MADWKNLTVRDVITEIAGNKIALPVIQRRLEWPEGKMEMLFDSLFKQNSFGSIICIEEAKGFEPLFAHRLFTLDGSDTASYEPQIVSDNLLLVIDGQQRLQSFYMGLCGSYYGKTLYYNLFSNYKQYDHNFKFAMTKDDLPVKNSESPEIEEYLWYPAPYLFEQLQRLANTDLVAEEVLSKNGITDPLRQKYIEKNIENFYARIFADHSIGISKVIARLSTDITEDRQRVTELFRRLNFEGMKLSTLDLVASLIKNFDYRMENFIDEVCRDSARMGIDQDVLIKLLLILNDKPTSGISDLSAEDAKFATSSRKRIEATLSALQKFLCASGNDRWFDVGAGAIKRSAIPLYVLAYHIFYQNCGTNELQNLFNRFDVKDKDFRNMSLWLKMSLLNQVFKRGCGWIPEKTGVSKIHAILRKNKGGLFPLSEIFQLYRERLHKFIDAKEVSIQTIDNLDQEYIFYLMYNGTTRSSIRFEDKDHIQPKSLLQKNGVPSIKINSIGNLQLIDLATNRGIKNDRPLSEWIELVDDKAAYIERHLIPEDEALWDIKKFYEFLRARLKKIESKIKSGL